MADISFPPVVATSTYFANGSTMSLSSLLTSYPASASNLGLYARVSNLYGSVDDIMRCRFDGTNYNWVPQRESATGTTAMSSGTVNFVPLFTPTTLIFSASVLTGNVNAALSSVNAYNGQPAEIVTPSGLTLGLYTMSITGLIGSNVSLLAGQTKRFRYASGWYLLP